MTQPKKHPLEVFRSSQQLRGGIGGSSHGGGGAGGDSGDPPDGPREPKEGASDDRRGPANSFAAMVMTLPGILTVVFVFILLMGFSHYQGFKRGERAARGEMDATALEFGRSLERQVPEAPKTENSAAKSGSGWWGVLAATYKKGQGGIAEEMKKTLSESYGFSGFVTWVHTDGNIEVMVGKAQRSDDPDLKDLERRLRLIEDYPASIKRPFLTAKIKEHPQDPTRPPAGD